MEAAIELFERIMLEELREREWLISVRRSDLENYDLVIGQCNSQIAFYVSLIEKAKGRL